MSIPARNVAKSSNGKSKKKRPEAHLLIGYDTEYQSRAATPSIDEGARNELLSYQFSVKLLAENVRGDEPSVDGIIIPAGDERILLRELVGFAIGSLIEKYPDIEVPIDIYVIGHFLRADLPAFSDFSDQAKTFMSNVRGTFVSIDSSIPVSFKHADGEDSIFRVKIRDTILLAPANAKSLADIGEIVGLEKIKVANTAAEELAVKENMADYRRDHWHHFRDYAIRDATVCVLYAESIIRQNQELFGEFKMPATLTSFGTKLVIRGWKEQGLNPDDLLGREEIEEKKFSAKFGYFTKTKLHPLQEDVHFEEAFIIETYHGGRNEQFLYGIANEGKWRDHDLSSAYTTAMSIIGTPHWHDLQRLDSLDHVDPLSLAYFSVDFEFPDKIRFPTLPVRTANGIIFPRKGNSKCGAPELDLAKRLGADLKFRRGVLVPSDRERPIFRDFISTSIQKRGQHAKGTFHNLFWKEVGNSTYGKTAQGLREKRAYDLRSDDLVALPPSDITQPYFASFITSYTRAVLGEILNTFSDQVDVFSVTTDGFLSNANDDEIHRAKDGPLYSSFDKARSELDRSDTPLEIKHEVRQPIGWRTRGAATLKAGEGKNGIVLQKGGIKTNPLFDDAQENAFTVRQFLTRTPDSTVEYKSGVGMKDMIRGDTDFVFKSVTKKLAMEFDWKRRPICAKDVPTIFEGEEFTHLSFNTTPVENVAEFIHLRDTWEAYNKGSRKNLKSMRDYERFQQFLITRKDPDREKLKYLSTGPDADLKRLRRDLTRAFQQHQAGFDLIRQKMKIGHKDFAAHLRECGIPCKVDDVENGKKTPFKPHASLGTPAVINALKHLQSQFYPELEINQFLPEENTEQTENLR